jgi:hypothetical protein
MIIEVTGQKAGFGAKLVSHRKLTKPKQHGLDISGTFLILLRIYPFMQFYKTARSFPAFSRGQPTHPSSAA